MKMKKLTSIALAAALAIGTFGFSVPAKATEPTTTTTDYVLTIPATLNVKDAGWNATDGITANNSTHNFDTGKKLSVTATSEHGWKLEADGVTDTVSYNLAASGDNSSTYSSTADPASWEFSAAELNQASGTNKAMGIIVEDYSNKAAGNYQDTVTFTAKVEIAKAAAETPAVAQENCTFSPTNGTSTLSNANITTSMEYSTDNGTTWTDVTSAGSIASLAAGTVQIRVKETVDNLASEAVSITVPEVLRINELVGPYTGDRLTCEYYAGETWQALVDRYDLIKVYSGRAAFDRDGFIYYENGSAVLVTDLVDNTKTYEVQ